MELANARMAGNTAALPRAQQMQHSRPRRILKRLHPKRVFKKKPKKPKKPKGAGGLDNGMGSGLDLGGDNMDGLGEVGGLGDAGETDGGKQSDDKNKEPNDKEEKEENDKKEDGKEKEKDQKDEKENKKKEEKEEEGKEPSSNKKESMYDSSFAHGRSPGKCGR
ncbi:hypothetical protein MTO96_050852 [Rhipicephalus appendiculatus]